MFRIAWLMMKSGFLIMTKRSCAEEEEANHKFHAVDGNHGIVSYNYGSSTETTAMLL
jgi:hypothetical protein